MSSMTIEQLLTWAFVHELPKGGREDGIAGSGSAWAMISGFGALGTLVDSSPRGDWRPPFILEQGDPDPDAILIGQSVWALKVLTVIIPEGWSPLADWQNREAIDLAGPVVSSQVERVRQQSLIRRARSTQALVVSHAALSRRPTWECPEPGVRDHLRGGKPAWFVRRAMAGAIPGQAFEVEVDGWDKRRCCPHRGAYRKRELADDPRPGIMARMDWQIWVSALKYLERRVEAVGLANHRLRPLQLPSEPWGVSGSNVVHLA